LQIGPVTDLRAAPSGEVRLRLVSEADLPIFFEQQADPVATRMAAFPARDREAFMTHWERIMRDPANVLRTILHDGEVAGNLLSWNQAGQQAIGYWLGRQFWGKGIATRALAAFLEQFKTRPLYAHVAGHNIASRRVLEKCGFVAWARERVVDPDGTVLEEYVLKLGPDANDAASVGSAGPD
jgi:RimJ/RimL family protein N-acetyltransferase